MSIDHEIADTADVAQRAGSALAAELCDRQAFFLLILDEHAGKIPVVEDLAPRDERERSRAANILRMWANRIEGKAPPGTPRELADRLTAEFSAQAEKLRAEEATARTAGQAGIAHNHNREAWAFEQAARHVEKTARGL